MSFRSFFARAVENWPAKVLSLALAIVLFIFHRMSVIETRSFFTPIVIEHLSALAPDSPYPRMMRVSLRGEGGGLQSILENDIEVYVDMEKINSPGAYIVPVQWRKKGTALGVDPLQISVDPMEINFSLDHKISKYVPLFMNFRGQLDAGYNMTSFSLEPAQVIVEGPLSLMAGISELYTEPVDLSGRRSDFFVTAAIVNNDPLIAIRGNGTAEFSGTISQIIPVRSISGVPITISGLANGFTGELGIKTGSIRLEGDNQNVVERFEPPPGFLRVDCSGISEPGAYILRVIAGSAEGVRLRVEPQEVRIEISQTGG